MLQENLARAVASDNQEYLVSDYSNLDTEYDDKTKSLWVYMHAEPRPSFTWGLLNDLHKLLFRIEETHDSTGGEVEYIVGASSVAGVFNLGGDLEKFIEYIRAGDADRLRAYAYASVEIGYSCYQQFNRNIVSIALVEGSCYGGGLEAALSCNILIAEESAQLGFPEISFNLFPGMGAYSFLSRRVAPNIAEKIITSGKIYSARELYELGVIDQCVPDGEGHQATIDFISQHRRQRNGRVAMHKARQAVQPVTLEELRNVCDIWVDAAMHLDARGLRVMERFSRAQMNQKFARRSRVLMKS